MVVNNISLPKVSAVQHMNKKKKKKDQRSPKFELETCSVASSQCILLNIIGARCNIKSPSLFLTTVAFFTRLTLSPRPLFFFFSSLPALCKLCLWKSAIQIKLSLSPPTLKSPLTRLKHISSPLKAARRLERQIAHKAHKHSSPRPPSLVHYYPPE